MDTVTGPALASPHACYFVTWLLRCTHRRHPCFLLVAMPLHCPVLPLHPRRSNGPALVAVANAKAPQLPLPPKLGWPVSPVFWVLRHAVGHLRRPWDPPDRARQEPPIGARCPVTPVDGMISGYDYDYDYIIHMYILVVCSKVRAYLKVHGGPAPQCAPSSRAVANRGDDDAGRQLINNCCSWLAPAMGHFYRPCITGIRGSGFGSCYITTSVA